MDCQFDFVRRFFETFLQCLCWIWFYLLQDLMYDTKILPNTRQLYCYTYTWANICSPISYHNLLQSFSFSCLYIFTQVSITRGFNYWNCLLIIHINTLVWTQCTHYMYIWTKASNFNVNLTNGNSIIVFCVVYAMVILGRPTNCFILKQLRIHYYFI